MTGWRTLTAIAAIGFSFLATDRALATPLVSPLAALAVPPSAGSARCPSPPPAVARLGGIAFYTDSQHSIVDLARRAENNRMQRPVVDFVDAIADMSDAWRRSGDGGRALCTAAWLDRWGTDGAFRETSDVGGGYRRSWYLAGLAIAWLKVRDAPGIDPRQGRRITSWLAAQAQLITVFYASAQRARDARNNHGDWAALAVAAAAVAADDATLFDWAGRRFAANLAEVAPNGALPLELARGQRALHYHLFALTPLALMARFERANGRPYDAGALRRLESFVRSALAHSRIVDAASGVRQEIPDAKSDASEWVWVAIGNGNNGPRVRQMLAARRPLRDPRSGGEVRLTWPVAER